MAVNVCRCDEAPQCQCFAHQVAFFLFEDDHSVKVMRTEGRHSGSPPGAASGMPPCVQRRLSHGDCPHAHPCLQRTRNVFLAQPALPHTLARRDGEPLMSTAELSRRHSSARTRRSHSESAAFGIVSYINVFRRNKRWRAARQICYNNAILD